MWFSNRKQVLNIIIRHLIITGIAIILASTVVFFTSQNILKIGVSLSQKSKLSKILAARIENVQQLRQSAIVIGDNDKKIQAVYPPADNILEFVSALESLASQNSLKQNLKFGEFVSTANVKGEEIKTSYTINLNGTADTLKKYLEQMEKLPFANKIGSVNLMSAPPYGWDGESTITINGTLYVR